MKVRALILAVVAGSLATLTAGHAAVLPTVHLQMSNFRFCPDVDTRGPVPCDPLDIAYVPYEEGSPTGSPAAPVAPVYNPIVETSVHPGQVVSWTYRDSTGCDAFKFQGATCPGHEVKFVNGPRVGFILREHEGTSISFTVPASAHPGDELPYYCAVNALHYGLGMTGVLKVV